MKLLSKTSLLIITASIFIFWIGNIAFFYVSKKMISDHIDSELLNQMHNIVTQIGEQEPGSVPINFSDDVSIRSIGPDKRQNPVLWDTVLYNEIQRVYIPTRALKFSFHSGGQNQLITVYKSLLSSDNLIERITVSSVILVIVFMIMIFVLNRYIFTNVWSSFSGSLRKVDDYDIKSAEKLSLPDSEIDEFQKLNAVLLKMVDRIQSDYQSLKELTANTSHEIQTPLAIIEGKAELLLQSERLNEEEMGTVYSILNTAERLSKLNQSLLLIAKIENNQFEESDEIELKGSLEKYIDDLEILFSTGNFVINPLLESCTVKINPTLLDVLFTNLLKNAIAHGNQGSEIGLNLRNCRFSISNSGEPLPFSSDQIFKRFIKGSNKKGGTGIGLEIVRKICNYYHLQVDYSYEEDRHIFSIDFSAILITS